MNKFVLMILIVGILTVAVQDAEAGWWSRVKDKIKKIIKKIKGIPTTDLNKFCARDNAKCTCRYKCKAGEKRMPGCEAKYPYRIFSIGRKACSKVQNCCK